MENATPSHSSLGPSSAKRWINCAASIRLQAEAIAKYGKRPTNEHAAGGTVAHKLAEDFLRGKIDELDMMALIGTTRMQEGHEIEITEEMLDGAILYRDSVEAIIKQVKAQKKPAPVVDKIEERVKASSVDERIWGTADRIVYQKGNVLHIFDYKFGKGVVEVEANEQMGTYAVAVQDTIGCDAFDEVWLHVIQPRAWHEDGRVRSWQVPEGWLTEFRSILKLSAAQTLRADAQVKAGDWCRWCEADAICPALRKKVGEVVRADFEVLTAPASGALKENENVALAVSGLPPVGAIALGNLAAVLKWEDTVSAWFKSLNAHAFGLLNSGQAVPGLKLVRGKSNRIFPDQDAVIARYKPSLGERLWEKKLLSPAKLEKIVGKGKIDDLTEKPEGALKVAFDDDPRQATIGGEGVRESFPPLPPHQMAPALPLEDDPLALAVGDLEAELAGGAKVVSNGTAPTRKMWPD